MSEENLLDIFNSKIQSHKVESKIISKTEIFDDLRSVKQSYSQFGIDSLLKFGKYKGRKIRDILKEDVEYLVWLGSKYKFTDELSDAISGE